MVKFQNPPVFYSTISTRVTLQKIEKPISYRPPSDFFISSHILLVLLFVKRVIILAAIPTPSVEIVRGRALIEFCKGFFYAAFTTGLHHCLSGEIRTPDALDRSQPFRPLNYREVLCLIQLDQRSIATAFRAVNPPVRPITNRVQHWLFKGISGNIRLVRSAWPFHSVNGSRNSPSI